jgi:hypothetical protein
MATNRPPASIYHRQVSLQTAESRVIVTFNLTNIEGGGISLTRFVGGSDKHSARLQRETRIIMGASHGLAPSRVNVPVLLHSSPYSQS